MYNTIIYRVINQQLAPKQNSLADLFALPSDFTPVQLGLPRRLEGHPDARHLPPVGRLLQPQQNPRDLPLQLCEKCRKMYRIIRIIIYHNTQTYRNDRQNYVYTCNMYYMYMLKNNYIYNIIYVYYIVTPKRIIFESKIMQTPI